MLVDSHCHLDMVLDADATTSVEGLLQAAQENDVQHMLCVCCNLDHFPRIYEMAESHAQLSTSLGVHPNEEVAAEPSFEQLVELGKKSQVVAIGETGLDYYRTSGDDVLWQQQRFRNHIRTSKEVNKPLIIHTREAREDTISIMQEENAAAAGGVMHCFTETWEMAKQALDMGFYISFSGIITFKNAQSLRDLVQKVPLDRILIETDAPYLAPVPYRGKTNQPAYVKYVAQCVAELIEKPYAEVARQTTENFFRLFKDVERR